MPEEGEFVERPALLFRAGHYPKKNLTVTEADLEKVAAGTNALPVHAPVQVGHVEEQFKLGTVHSLLVKGKELWGTLRLHKVADKLLDLNDNLRTISSGIFRDFRAIKEVSVTGTPAVAGAQMFNDTTTADDDAFTFALGEEETPPMPDDKPGVTVEQFSKLQADSARQSALIAELTAKLGEKDTEIKSVQFSMLKREAEAKVALFSKKIPPVLQPKAVALLMAADQVVTFSDAEVSVAELFSDFMEGLPVVIGKGITGNPTGGKGSEEEAVAKFSGMGLSPEGAKLAAAEYIKMQEGK